MQQINFNANDRPVRGRAVKRAKRKTATKSLFRKKATVKKKSRSQRGELFLVRVLRVCFSSLVTLISSSQVNKTSSRKRGARGGWSRLASVGALTLAIVGSVGGLGFYIVQNSLVEKSIASIKVNTQEALTSLGLTVQEISVAGRERTSSKSLMKALAVARGDNIFDFDPELARERIEQLGWVERASVMRRFPDEIYVRIDERRPFARWQKDRKTAVIDRKGAIVTYRQSSEFQYLPKVVGVGANEDAAELFDMLAKTPALFTRLQNAVRIRDRRWNLEFDNGVSVLLPEEGEEKAWQKLFEMQRTKNVLNKGVVAIDLRSDNKIYVRLKPDDALVRRKIGNET
ncbi:MAG: FtsQ-type POTRA domain-containing protein [Sneathiella sp.]